VALPSFAHRRCAAGSKIPRRRYYRRQNFQETRTDEIRQSSRQTHYLSSVIFAASPVAIREIPYAPWIAYMRPAVPLPPLTDFSRRHKMQSLSSKFFQTLGGFSRAQSNFMVFDHAPRMPGVHRLRRQQQINSTSQLGSRRADHPGSTPGRHHRAFLWNSDYWCVSAILHGKRQQRFAAFQPHHREPV